MNNYQEIKLKFLYNCTMLIVPSILSCNWGAIVNELADCTTLGITQVHLDVMDGVFVPSITFGEKFIKDIRSTTDLIFDTHIMVEHPEHHVDAIISAGSDMITFHIEATRYSIRLINYIRTRYQKIKIGIALNPQTSTSEVEPILDVIDLVLLMGVEPGYGGQQYISSVHKKIDALSSLRQKNKYNYIISLDGGVNALNAKEFISLGVDTLVMGSSFFGAKDKKVLLEQILNDI